MASKERKPVVIDTVPVKPATVKASAVSPPKPPKPVAAKAAAPAAPKIDAPAPIAEPAPDPVVTATVMTTEAPEAPALPEPNIDPAPVAVAAPAALIQKEVTIMEATITNVTEKAQTLFAEASASAKAAVEKSTKLFEEANEFSKGNVEAIVESGKIAAKGIETLGQDAAEYSRKQFEGATAALKSLSAVKSPTDFFKLQSDYVRASFDSIVAQTSKSTEAMIKLAGDVTQPISTRVALAADKVKIAA